MERDQDALFDVCCYLGRGSIPDFTMLHRQCIGENEYASETLRNLHSLGHIILLRDGEDGPSLWSVASPAFIITGPDKAYLRGYRSESFLEQLESLINSKGGKTKRTPQEDGPSIISFEGISPTVLQQLKQEIKAPHRDPVGVYLAPHLSPDEPVIPRDELVAQLPKSSAPNFAKFFNPALARWEDTLDPDVLGFFKINARPVQYRLRRQGGMWLTAPYPLGKHVVAFDNDQRLMDYDADSMFLTCPLGAPLPSPYDFLATNCTGFLPIKQSGKLRYSGVTPGVASKIWRALYGRS